VKFEQGNKVGHGGKRPGAGRPSKKEAAAKEEMIRAAMDALKLSMFKAVTTLVKHVDSRQENISIRAAQSLIEYALRAVEHDELEHRIQALEQAAQQQAGNFR